MPPCVAQDAESGKKLYPSRKEHQPQNIRQVQEDPLSQKILC